MANMNLTTSYETDLYIDTEVEYLKSLGHRVSRVDLVNYVCSIILNNNDISDTIRDKIIEKLDNMEVEKQKRIQSIKRGEK